MVGPLELQDPESAPAHHGNVEGPVTPEPSAVGQSSAMTRELGQDRGRFTVPEDFDAPLPEDVQRSFEG